MKDMGVRIAFITQAAPWEANLTFGQFNIDQAAALKRLGAQCEIFAPMMRVPRMLNRFSAAIRRRNSRPGDYEFGGVEVHVLRAWMPHPVFMRWKIAPWAPSLPAGWISLMLRRRLEARLRDFKPDVLLVHDGVILGTLARQMSRRLGVPYALIEHDPIDFDPSSRAGRWYARQFADAKAIFTVNAPTLAHLRDKLKLPQGTLVRNGALMASEEQRRAPRPAKWEGKKLVLSVGGFIPRKAHAELVRAFADANIANSVLVLISPRPPPAALAEVIEQATKSGASIEVLQGIGPHEVQQYMVWGDLFALPSWWEAFGLVYAEAMAAETPIILSSDSGMASEVKDRVHGWIVPPRDHEALVAALREALTQADLPAMGRAGRALVERNFTWDQNAAAVLQTLAASPQPAPASLAHTENTESSRTPSVR